VAARGSSSSSAGRCWHSVAGAGMGLSLLGRYEAVMKEHWARRSLMEPGSRANASREGVNNAARSFRRNDSCAHRAL
jgi:hypothetical protein